MKQTKPNDINLYKSIDHYLKNDSNEHNKDFIDISSLMRFKFLCIMAKEESKVFNRHTHRQATLNEQFINKKNNNLNNLDNDDKIIRRSPIKRRNSLSDSMKYKKNFKKMDTLNLIQNLNENNNNNKYIIEEKKNLVDKFSISIPTSADFTLKAENNFLLNKKNKSGKNSDNKFEIISENIESEEKLSVKSLNNDNSQISRISRKSRISTISRISRISRISKKSKISRMSRKSHLSKSNDDNYIHRVKLSKLELGFIESFRTIMKSKNTSQTPKK